MKYDKKSIIILTLSILLMISICFSTIILGAYRGQQNTASTVSSKAISMPTVQPTIQPIVQSCQGSFEQDVSEDSSQMEAPTIEENFHFQESPKESIHKTFEVKEKDDLMIVFVPCRLKPMSNKAKIKFTIEDPNGKEVFVMEGADFYGEENTYMVPVYEGAWTYHLEYDATAIERILYNDGPYRIQGLLGNSELNQSGIRFHAFPHNQEVQNNQCIQERVKIEEMFHFQARLKESINKSFKVEEKNNLVVTFYPYPLKPMNDKVKIRLSIQNPDGKEVLVMEDNDFYGKQKECSIPVYDGTWRYHLEYDATKAGNILFNDGTYLIEGILEEK